MRHPKVPPGELLWTWRHFEAYRPDPLRTLVRCKRCKREFCGDTAQPFSPALAQIFGMWLSGHPAQGACT